MAVRRTPLAGRTLVVRAPEGASLEEMALLAAPDPFLRRHLVAFVNGAEIARDIWTEMRPAAGAAINFIVRPADGGGDGGSGDILRTILQIVVIVVAAWITGGAGGVWAAGSWQAVGAAAIFSVAANLAINSLIPLNAPKTQERPPALNAVTGARNQAQLYSTVPMVVGRHRMVPPLYGQPIQETVGNEIWLRIPYCFGPAPIQLTDLRIGETPLSSYTDYQWEERLTADAPAHTLYAGDPYQEPVGAKLDETWTTRNTVADVDEIEIVYGFRAGLGALDDKGRKQPMTVQLVVEYRPAGTSEPWSRQRPDVAQANAIAADLDDWADRTTYRTRYFSFSSWENTADALYADAINGLVPVTRADPGRGFQKVVAWAVPRGQYEVRTRRANAESIDTKRIDGVWWEVLGSRKSYLDPFPERRIASGVLRMRGTDQLSGVIDTLNGVATTIAPKFSAEAKADPLAASAASLTSQGPTRNPSELSLNAWRGPQVANPAPDHEIDWPAWAEFAQWCELMGLHFDEVVQGAPTTDDLVRRICAAAFARPVRLNGRRSVVIDRPRAGEPPSQVFTPRNVSGFRWRKTFPAETHALRISFANELNGWQADEVTLYRPGYDAANATKFETLELPGKTHPDEVRTVGMQYFRNAEYQTETFSFDLDIESLTATLGAYVIAQHDVMVTGLGSAKVASLILDGANVAGVRLDAEVDAGDFTGPFAMRWRSIVEEAGWARFEASAEEAVATPDAPDPDRGRVWMFTTPLAAADAPEIGDLVVIGETGQVAIEGLIQRIEPDADFRARVTLVNYAGERFLDGPTWPPHNPLTSIPLGARPATPVLQTALSRNGEISVSFFQPASPRGVVVTGFETAWRETGEGEDSWTILPPLGPFERVLVAPPGDPEAEYDVRIVAVGREAGGLTVRSDALLVEAISADAKPDAPTGVAASFEVRTSAAGAKQVVLLANWTPNEDPQVIETRIEVQTGETAWSAIGGGRPALGRAEIHGLQVGRTYAFGFVHVTARGAVSDRVVLDPIVAPDALGVPWDGVTGKPAFLETAEEALEGVTSVIAGLFPGFAFVGALGTVDVVANLTSPSSIRILPGFFDHPAVGKITVAQVDFATAWSAYYAPSTGWFAIIWSQEATATRFGPSVGAGNFFPAVYESGGWKAYGAGDHETGIAFTPRATDLVVAKATKERLSGEGNFGRYDGVTDVEVYIRPTLVIDSKVAALETTVGQPSDPANPNGGLFARIKSQTSALLTESQTRATQVSSVEAQLAGKASVAAVNSVTQAVAGVNQALALFQQSVAASFAGTASQANVNLLAQSLASLSQAFSQYQLTVASQLAGKASAASVNQVAQSLATLQQSFASFQQQVIASFNTSGTASSASVELLQQVVAALDIAFAQYRQTTSITLNGLTGSVQAVQTALADTRGFLNLGWALTLDGNGRAVGIKALNNGETAGLYFSGDAFFDGTINAKKIIDRSIGTSQIAPNTTFRRQPFSGGDYTIPSDGSYGTFLSGTLVSSGGQIELEYDVNIGTTTTCGVDVRCYLGGVMLEREPHHYVHGPFTETFQAKLRFSCANSTVFELKARAKNGVSNVSGVLVSNITASAIELLV